MSKTIQVYNRATRSIFVEKVLGDFAMRCAYGNSASTWFTSKVLVRRNISNIMGMFYDSRLSKPMIRSFVRDFNINMSESELDLEKFACFNDFFTRKLVPAARPICNNPTHVASPGDGRLLVFPKINNQTVSHVKWAPIRLLDLFKCAPPLANIFDGGSCAILRLCPADYHRFHFPAAGVPGETRAIDGALHSVNPYALEQKIPVYCLNKRTLCEFNSNNFGKIAILEIGALGVGGIVQTYHPDASVEAGAEKGFFKFGGSTTILFFEPNKIRFDDDLVSNSENGTETLVRMGESIGVGI